MHTVKRAEGIGIKQLPSSIRDLSKKLMQLWVEIYIVTLRQLIETVSQLMFVWSGGVFSQ